MNNKYLYLVLCVAAGFVVKVSSDQVSRLTEIVQHCCTVGEDAAKENAPEPCDSIGLPDDIDESMEPICANMATMCCKTRLKVESADCELGIDLAMENGACSTLKNETSQVCCDKCKLGKFAGSTGGIKACTGDGAYKDCCLKAAVDTDDLDNNGSDPTNNEINTLSGYSTTSDNDIFGESSSLEPSICEQFAPDELCAHYCIPVPGSYKCECKHGFLLMSDGKSCKKNDKDRCKTNNTCEQKCLDTGREIKCSCRRGYELLEDLKSCIDVDECTLQIHNCKATQKCVNTIGSYKCEALQVFADQTHKKNPGKSCPPGFIYNRKNQVCDDIDECKENSSCPEGNICTNTIGSFKCSFDANQPITPKRWSHTADSEEAQCPPGFKYDSSTADCIDVDECVQNLDDCNRKSQICLNTYGRFTCQDKVSKTNCPPGFKINPINSSCEDINECLESSDLCARGTECVNEPGGYDCKKIHPTSSNRNPNAVPSRRQNVSIMQPTPTNSQREPHCPAGYRKVHNGCQDIDECAEGGHSCDLYQDCENNRGSYLCKCKQGFRLDNYTLACVDINECESDNLNDCLESQRCDNTIGSYHCVRYMSCGTGYTLNSMSGNCEDNDECASGQNDCRAIGRDFTCLNLPGTFRCIRMTTPSTSKPTTPLAAPQYNPGSADESYYDEDETDENPDYADPSGVSNNTSRDHTKPDSAPGTNPQNIPMTVSNGEVVVNVSSLPQNRWTTLGRNGSSPSRNCIPGYTMNSKGDCIDVDECTTGHHMCQLATEFCENKIGSYTCVCIAGFIRDGNSGTCREIVIQDPQPEQEVTENQPLFIVTMPTPASPVLVTPISISKYLPRFWTTNSCDSGYHYDPTTARCLDVDECETKTAVCAPEGELCVNTPGGYRCECLPGWYIDHVRHRCVPNLAAKPTVEPDNYVPSLVKYQTPYRKPTQTVINQCSKGFKWDEAAEKCVDIDECSSGPFPCSPTQTCSNMIGGYICRCPIGHKIINSECVDIDECIEYKGKACSHHSRCVNTVGSYRCECGPGFEQSKESDRMCQDKDECTSGEAGCEDVCINVWGSYRCACRHGFKLSSNNKTCNDVNECEEFADRNICVGECINIPGNYSCSCPSGYRLAADNRNCIDIDECDPRDGNPSPCPFNQVCQNTRGGFKCYSVSCPQGYVKQDTSKNRCIRAPNACVSGLIDCSKTPDTYSFNFITFVSRLYIPAPPRSQVDLFTMRGPTWPGAELNFSLRLLKVEAPSSLKEPANLHSFLLTSSQQQAMVSLVKSLEGPQDIELELVMELFTKRTFEGTAIAKIFIYVSPYEF